MSLAQQVPSDSPFAYDRSIGERLLPRQEAAELFSLQHNSCADYIEGFDPARNLISLPHGAKKIETVVLLHPEQQVITHPVKIENEHVIDLSLCMAGESINPFPATVSLRYLNEEGVSRELISFHLHLFDPARRHDLQVAIPQLVGTTARFSLSIRHTALPAHSVCISRFLICPKLSIERVNALTNYELRATNELSLFSDSSYTHPMYGEAGRISDGSHLVQKLTTRTKTTADFTMEQERRLRDKLALLTPSPNEPVFNFSQRCLAHVLQVTAPNIFAFVAGVRKNRPLRVLSLCSGSARVEEQMLMHSPNSIDLTLFDVSEPLIRRAASRIDQPRHSINYLVGDINNGIPSSDTYDIIVCVSALHHVVELELVLAQINERLAPDGTFWNLGEQIGRNGNRLWPEGLKAANLAFSKLPERLRVNSITKQPDLEIPDDDFSVNCFEGIRSESLESLLERFLVPHQVYKSNCFLWRLTDQTYCDNYDLSTEQDTEQLKTLVVAEAMHWLQGGRPTELHAIYKRKQF